jgi:hypothetical protein
MWYLLALGDNAAFGLLVVSGGVAVFLFSYLLGDSLWRKRRWRRALKRHGRSVEK